MAVQATAKALREAFIDRPDIAQGLQSILGIGSIKFHVSCSR